MEDASNEDIAGQLAALFRAGLESEPGLASDLASTLASFNVPPDHPDAEHKLTKAEANYRKVSNDSPDGANCGNCRFFHGDCCSVVAGTIDASYVSDYYHDDEHSRPQAGMEND